MMLPYPFFNPFYFRRPYSYNSYKKPIHSFDKNDNSYSQISYSPSISPKKEQGNFENSSNNMDNTNTSEEYFEIFGLKLYFDDLLIIALLFFLYQEEVKDTYLYIALILLLLS